MACKPETSKMNIKKLLHNVSVFVMPVFLPVTEYDVGVNNITLRWIAELGPDPYELVITNQTGFVEATNHTIQSGLVIWFNRVFHNLCEVGRNGIIDIKGFNNSKNKLPPVGLMLEIIIGLGVKCLTK